MSIKNQLENLTTQDIYSLLLFSLFKIKELPEYSTLSELCYLLDQNNLLKLCEYCGGMTIKIPTIAQLENLINILILYKYVHIDKIEFEEALLKIDLSQLNIKQIKRDYYKLESVLDKYDFRRNDTV